MAEGVCATCGRYLLVGLNLLFWVVGILLIGAGIWAITDDAAMETLRDNIHLKLNIDTVNAVGYTSIGVGAFMFLVGFCGCCGAIRESPLMLGVYVLFMVILLLGEVALTIYYAVEQSTIEEMVKSQLMADVSNYTTYNNESDLAIDFLQVQFHCCGSDGFLDYVNKTIPDSCCVTKNDDVPAIPGNRTACRIEADNRLTNGTQLYTTGCFNILKDLIEENSAILIGVLAGIVCIEILGIVFAVLVCRNRSEYEFYDD